MGVRFARAGATGSDQHGLSEIDVLNTSY
jgi:hypothetical protein